MKKTIPELDAHITKNIQGVFSQTDMVIMKAEIEKLNSGDVYLEIGVNEGKSYSVAHHYAADGVYTIGIDPYDVPPHEFSVGRSVWMEKEGMIGIGKRGFYVHGDADVFAELFNVPFIKLLFIDGHHDYDSVKNNTLMWEQLVVSGGVILYHDYDHPETKRWLDEHYDKGDIEIFHGKIVKFVV